MRDCGLLLVVTLTLTSCIAPPARLTRRPVMRAPVVQSESADLRLYRLLSEALGVATLADSKSVALGDFVALWKKTYPGQSSGKLIPPKDLPDAPTLEFQFKEDGRGLDRLADFDEISPAADYQINKLANTHKTVGIGTPLLAYRENRVQLPIEKYDPPEGIAPPVTAVLVPVRKQKGIQKLEVRLLNPCNTPELRIRGKTYPLAADWSVGWAYLLSKTSDLAKITLTGFLQSEAPREPGFFLLQPYDPNKIPLIMVHGLFSTPLAWADLTNDLWGDKSVRDRYQIWHYYYPTSAPPFYTARLLRPALEELRKTLDPSQKDPAMQRTVIVAHSMGGLISKSLINTTGTAFWDKAFTRPLEELQVTPETRATLKRAFFWEPVPHIRRVIYVATPHRGSALAGSPAGWLGRWLAGTPSNFSKFYRMVHEEDPSALTPTYVGLATGKVSSVTALHPNNPSMLIHNKLPVSRRVKQHSIIGNRGDKGPLEQSSDGVVPYFSSHIEDAESELVVPVGHDAFRHPDALQEIVRILNLESAPR